MIRVKEAIIVEGRYDKARLAGLVEGIVVETGGFQIFQDRQRMALIRRLAAQRGVVVLTDSDGAGFLIRGKLSQCLPPSQVKHAYIPDVPGKERRKAKPSKEGKLGVEGMSLEALEHSLRRAGAEIDSGGEASLPAEEALTKTDLFRLGLSGGPGSGEKRKRLQARLGLPERLSANGLLQALNGLYTKAQVEKLAEELEAGEVFSGPE